MKDDCQIGETKTNAAAAAAQGTPEETSLTVKFLGEEWIVENGLGEAVATAADCSGAIQKARQIARATQASGISVLDADGTKKETLTVEP